MANLPHGNCKGCGRRIEAYPGDDGQWIWLCLRCAYRLALKALGE